MPLLSHRALMSVSIIFGCVMFTGYSLASESSAVLSTADSSPQTRPTFQVSYKKGNISWASGFRYDANDVYVGRINYGPGADNTWLTRDDDVTGYDDFTYDASGNPTRQVYYSSWSMGAGPDGVWFNDDDEPENYIDNTYDTKGNRIRQVSYSGWSEGAGPDGNWFTGDDVPNKYTDYTYDADDNLVRRANYNNAGPDGAWFTPMTY